MIRKLVKLKSLFSKKDKMIFCFILFCMMISSLLEVVSIGSFPVFFSILANPEKLDEIPLVASVVKALKLNLTNDAMIWGGIALICIILIKNVYKIFIITLQAWFTKSRMVILSNRVYSAYINAPYYFHLQRNSAELLRNVQTESNRVSNGMLKSMLQISMQIFTIIAVLILLLYWEPYISLIGLGFFLIVSFTYYGVNQKRMARYGLLIIKLNKDLIQSVQQGIGALKEAKVLKKEPFFIQVFFGIVKKRARILRNKEIIGNIVGPFMESMTVLSFALIFSYLIFIDREIDSIIPTLILLIVAFSRLRGCITNLLSAFTKLRFSIASVDPIYLDLNYLETIIPDDLSSEINHQFQLKNEIRFDNISYRYPESMIDVLEGTNFLIHKGNLIGFVGPTGAGKTTIIDILLGLLDPTKGKVYIDNQDMRKIRNSWQKRIGYIPQVIYLLDDSIKNNIALGIDNEKIKDNDLWCAIKAAQLDNFIGGLSNGIDTVIGEQGVRLSGGERQRIGIARALYHNPDVLIMDEATSALDNETEKALVKAIETLRGDKTIIIIAHRLSTVKNCDFLFFLKNGRIKSYGSYDELLSINPEIA